MSKGYVRRFALWLLDVVCVSLSFLAAVNLHFDEGMSLPEQASNRAVYAILLVLVCFFNLFVHENRGFMRRSGVREFARVVRYNLMLVFSVAVASFALHVDPTPSRLMLADIFVVNTVLMCVARWAAKRVVRAVFRDEQTGSPIVMIVAPDMQDAVRRRFRPGMTYTVAGWLTLSSDGRLEGTVRDQAIACSASDLPDVLRAHGVRNVQDFFVCAPHASERSLMQVVGAVERYGTNCHVAIGLPDPTLQGARLDYFGEMPVVTYVGRGSVLYRRYVKRLIDIVLSLVVIVLAFIPGALLALVIAAQSKGSPFYTQERLGVGGRHFRLLKFRSMVVDADDVEKYFTPEQLEVWHRERKVDDDPRITGIGRFLRKTSLDEFPQFINILKGDMSLVGPRPIVDEEIRHYGNREPEFLSIRPGLTGWWQVMARNAATYEDGTRQDLELYYVRHVSFTLDWNIVKRTFGAVLGGTGQ